MVETENLAEQFEQGLSSFWQAATVEFEEFNLQVLQSMTFGEMIIATLLLTFLVLFVFYWVWQVMFR